MKSEGMDASRVCLLVNYRMTIVLWMFLSLILLGRPSLVFSQDTTVPTATIKILPEYTAVPREGDSVTLDCEISSIESTDDVLWARMNSSHEPQQVIVNGSGLTVYADNHFYVLSLLQVVNSTTSLYSHKIIIDPLQQSDQGYYQCQVFRSSTVITQSINVHLLVHRHDAFPVCFPDGPATVTIGSSLSCKALSDMISLSVYDISMHTADNDKWVTSLTNGGGSQGQELTRTVTNSEHGKTFQCHSTSNVSATTLSCTIGLLVVLSETTQSQDVIGSTVSTTRIFTTADKHQNAGLSGADIAGIVIGVILLFIILAVHTLCCRCNPKRWLYAKSYPFNVGSSFASTLERDNAVLTQPDAKLRNAGPESDNLPFGVQASVYAKVNETTPVTNSKEPTELKPPAICAQVNEPTPEPDSEEPTGLKSPGIYAQVNKPTPITDTSEPITHQPNPSVNSTEMDKNASQDDEELLKENGKDSSNLKNIKRFGQNRNGQVSRPPQQEPVLIYADLDLKEPVNDEVHPPSDDSQTVYAQIKY